MTCHGRATTHGTGGCVLEGDFPWETLQEKRPPRFHEVRMRCRRDNISRLAAWLDRLIPGFGSAGYSGFQGNPKWYTMSIQQTSFAAPVKVPRLEFPSIT